MKYYLNLNQQSEHNEHELHKETCSKLPNINNQICIGDFSSDTDALYAAKNNYPQYSIDGCYYCCPSIHKM